MKRVIYVGLGALSILVLGACKKNYVCTCTTTTSYPSYTYNGVNYSGTTDQSIEQESFEVKKKASAEASCSFKEYEISLSSPNAAQGQGDGTEIKECKLDEF